MESSAPVTWVGKLFVQAVTARAHTVIFYSKELYHGTELFFFSFIFAFSL